MSAYLATAALLLGSLASATAERSATQLVVIRQDNTSTGFIENVDVTTGIVTKQSKEKFVFDWPLVEMTSDANTEDVYVVTYPEGYPGPVLYHLDHNLNLIYSWVNTAYSFFDLQYSPQQSAMYGILVTTSYGRALSNFTLDQQGDLITASELYTLPYMWYVNASSFDAENSRYFALINNFPGFENSTLDQQLIVADFSKDAKEVAPQVGLFPIASQDMLVQFVTYSHSLRTLFCAGTSRRGAEVAVMDQESGRVTRRIFSKAATAVGPLMYVPSSAHGSKQDQLTVYVQTAVQPEPIWELWALTLQKGTDGSLSQEITSTLINTYRGGDFQFFAGAATTK
jgi:hypothetical protein